jgi:hypothetical protein
VGKSCYTNELIHVPSHGLRVSIKDSLELLRLCLFDLFELANVAGFRISYLTHKQKVPVTDIVNVSEPTFFLFPFQMVKFIHRKLSVYL